MFTFGKGFFKSKTTWTGITSIVASIGAIATGAISLSVALPGIIIAAMGVVIRDTIAKNGEK